MGRSIPTDENDIFLIHPVLSLSLFAAGMAAATFAMITALCSFSRKKAQRNVDEDILQYPATLQTKEESLPSGVTDVKTTEEPAATISNETTAPQESETLYKEKEKEDGADLISKELPLPPRMKTSGIGAQAVNTWNANNAKTTTSQMKKSASERRLLSSLSLKLPRSLSMARKGEKNKEGESNNKRKNNMRKLSMSSVTSSVTTSMTSMTKQEESIWMKTIILGEKCKVPDEDDGAVIYDSKGRKIPAYHPKSRQNSFIDQNALPNQTRSSQCSFIDPSAIPDQRSSSATKDGKHRDEMISEDQEELMSLSQL